MICTAGDGLRRFVGALGVTPRAALPKLGILRPSLNVAQHRPNGGLLALVARQHYHSVRQDHSGSHLRTCEVIAHVDPSGGGAVLQHCLPLHYIPQDSAVWPVELSASLRSSAAFMPVDSQRILQIPCHFPQFLWRTICIIAPQPFQLCGLRGGDRGPLWLPALTAIEPSRHDPKHRTMQPCDVQPVADAGLRPRRWHVLIQT